MFHPFEPLLTTRLEWLTLKTAFLVAVTTAKRVGELQALSVDPRYYSSSAAGVRLRLNPVFIPKVNSAKNRGAENFLEPFYPQTDPSSSCTLYRLCPCRAIRKYVQATAVLRQTDQFFVSYAPGPRRGTAVSKVTISGWVRRAIAEAYKAKKLDPPEGIKAHQTRGQSASWAEFHNTPMVDILDTAKWENPCTFATFYQLNLAKNAGTATFGTRVLQAVLDSH
jgi:hypothetical protein